MAQNLRSKPAVFRGLRLWRVGMVVMLGMVMWGCDAEPKVSPVSPEEWPGPLLPSTISHDHAVTIDDLRERCEQPDGKLPADAVQNLITAYVASGRNFDEQADVVDGYILRVIPLNGNDVSVPYPAAITIYLFRGHHREAQAGQRALLRWEVADWQCEKFWTKTSLLDCYIFRLSFQGYDPGPGQYFFVVDYGFKHHNREQTLCGAVSFADAQRRETVDDTDAAVTDGTSGADAATDYNSSK